MPPDEARSAGAGWHNWQPPPVPPPLPPPDEPPPTPDPSQQDEDDAAVEQLLAQFRVNYTYLLNMTPTEPSQTPADESMRGGH